MMSEVHQLTPGSAFTEVAARRDELVARAHRHVPSADAEDVVHDVFLRMWDVTGVDNPVAYATTAIARRAIDNHRRTGRELKSADVDLDFRPDADGPCDPASTLSVGSSVGTLIREMLPTWLRECRSSGLLTERVTDDEMEMILWAYIVDRCEAADGCGQPPTEIGSAKAFLRPVYGALRSSVDASTSNGGLAHTVKRKHAKTIAFVVRQLAVALSDDPATDEYVAAGDAVLAELKAP